MIARHSRTLSGTFNAQPVSYTFSLDLVPVHGRTGRELGTSSVFSYIAEPPASRNRPVVFVFNGGPGAASALLHLSGIGPKRMAIPADLGAGARPPYDLQDSPHSILDVADLVFIDPIGTGFGRVLPEADTDELFSIEGDARYFADIVTGWIARNDRWNSPKYVLGESYGTHRAPFLATALMGIRAVALDGIILIGQAVNVQETRDRPGNVTGAVANIPFMAATAWYHRAGSQSHETVHQAVDAAIDFAYEDFLPALSKGNLLAAEEVAAVAKRLEAITGIAAEVFVRNRLWLSKDAFRKELLASTDHVVGGNDARYVAPATDPVAAEAEFDPSSPGIFPGFTACATRYLHGELGIPFDDEYRFFDETAPARWDWSDSGSAGSMGMGKPSPFHVYPYPARLTQFFKQVPHARLFIGTGVYDALTTVGAVEHLLRQYDLPLDQVTSRRYPAGHMMYTDEESSQMLTADLRVFLTA